MKIEERIKSLFTLEHPRVVISLKNFEELSRYASWVGLKPDERGRIHLMTAIGEVLVDCNEYCEDNHMMVWLCSGIGWNCPFALWEKCK